MIVGDPNSRDISPAFRILDFEGRLIGEPPKIPEEKLLNIYRTMMLLRLMDERMMILQRQGRVGFYGACTGQEAPPVASAAALQNRDWIVPGLREGGAMLYRDYPLELYLAQVFGNDLDPTKGRQMPSHQAARSVRQFSWSSCIGTQVPHAVGIGMGMALREPSSLVLCFFGDGATSTADVHRGLLNAASSKANCIFACQNNHWAISQPTSTQTRTKILVERVYAYGMPHIRVDGNDPLAIYMAVQEAAKHVRSGRGSVFLEMETYRIGAHSSSDDPSVYRDSAEVQAWKKRDPIQRMGFFLKEAGWLTEAQESSMKEEQSKQLAHAISVAETWDSAGNH